ncbi:MAG: hypothetical protein FWE86_03190 [Oscillospiraceae bacterium]|nr:hypothetical protein [Oscillospiraceae bacterium]
MSETQLTYKGYPLVRCKDEIYFGNMSDKFVTHLKINSTKKIGDTSVPTGVDIQMLYTDPDIKGKNKVYKESKKPSISAALELAAAWLARGK